MNVNGLRVNEILSVLEESNRDHWACVNNHPDTSVIDRFKLRNHRIAVGVAVVATVSVVAVFIFALVHWVVKPAIEEIPNPDYNPKANPGSVNARKMITKDRCAATGGIVGITFGSAILGCGLPFAFWAGCNKVLDSATVEPLREIRRTIAEMSLESSVLGAEVLIPLLKRCDTAGRKALVSHMNFEQLEQARKTLGRTKFRHLIKGVNTVAHDQWRMITEFEKMDGYGMITALRNKGQSFYYMLSTSSEASRIVREIIYNTKSDARVHLIRELDRMEGFRDLNPNGEKMTFIFSDGKQFACSKPWVIARSGFAKAMADLKGVAEPTVNIPDNIKYEDLLQCLDILKGGADLPRNVQDIEKLSDVADFFLMDKLIDCIGHVVIDLAKSKVIEKVDLISWMVNYTRPGEKSFDALRALAIHTAGTKKVKGIEEFCELWPLLKGFRQLEESYRSYYRSLLLTPDGFHAASEVAEQLNDEELRSLCLNHLVRQNSAYLLAVKAHYRINDQIPEWIKQALKVRDL